jgi:hypothetical protein
LRKSKPQSPLSQALQPPGHYRHRLQNQNERAVQFRKWAKQIVKAYSIQGWIMDTERLKRGGNLTDEFFERQLEMIKEIRLSERKFYQKTWK